MKTSLLGANIKQIRQRKKISASKLATKANVGAATISQIESGARQNLSSRTIEKIALALNVATDELLGTEDKVNVNFDIEEELEYALSTNNLSLDNNKMSEEEIKHVKVAVSVALNFIRLQKK